MNPPRVGVWGPRRSTRTGRGDAVILATLLTLGNLLCGVAALVFCAVRPQEGGLVAGWLILLGLVFDGADGWAARWRGGGSPFGAQIDALADMVTFGAAPPVVCCAVLFSRTAEAGALQWGHTALLAAVGLYVCAGAARLARYVVNVGDARAPQTFEGLPTPGAAASVAAVLLWLIEPASATAWAPASCIALMTGLLVVLGLLMVSTLPYSHEANALGSIRSALPLVVVLVAAALISLWSWRAALVLTAAMYVVSGPTRALLGGRRRARVVPIRSRV